uniref:Uncharacterized protein n=1 Tax=Rhizophora mucronata TaxID=61149 RepID=A0A2P2PSB4_RHIMU
MKILVSSIICVCPKDLINKLRNNCGFSCNCLQ